MSSKVSPTHAVAMPGQPKGFDVRKWAMVPSMALLLGLLVLGVTTPAPAATRVVKVRSGSPAMLADILRQTYGRQLRIAEAPMISALVLNAEHHHLLDQAAALLAQLDQPPVTFRFSLRRISAEEARAWQVGAAPHRERGAQIQAQQTSRQERGTDVRTVMGLEGVPVALLDETTRIVDLSTPWGLQTAVLKSERGLRILGRRAGDGMAVVEIRAADGTGTSATRLMSQVAVKLGEWTYLGDVASDRTEGGTDVRWQGTRGGGSIGRSSGRQSAHYLVKVEVVGP
jgi:hypothetical protein